MKKLLLIVILSLTGGCNEINDFDHFWDDAQPDPMLVGQWGDGEGLICEFQPSEDNLILREIAPTNRTSKIMASLYFNADKVPVRSLTFHGYTFLLIKRPNGSGAICRYVLSSNELAFFQLRDSVLEQGIRANIIQGIVPDRMPYNSAESSVPNPLTAFQSCEISVLTSNAMNFFISEDNRNYWDALKSFTKRNR